MRLRTTLQDIATACGISKSTVARVLSGNPHVSANARKIVEAKAAELGYRPDPSLRILSQHRWNRNTTSNLTIALITQQIGRNDSAKTYRASLSAAAERMGYRLEEFPISNYPSTSKLGTILFSRGIRGLIIPPIIHEIDWDLDWSRFTAVGCGIGEFRLPIHSIDINHFSAVRMCWQQCLARGYQRIGAALYRQPGPDQNDSLRHAAILYEQSLFPAEYARLPIFAGDFDDKAAFNEWFRRHRPDAVISLNEVSYWDIKNLGKSIPEDVGYCVVNHSSLKDGKTAGASAQRSRIAELAVNWLDQLIRSNETGLPSVPDEILIEPEWIEQPSLRPIRKAI